MTIFVLSRMRLALVAVAATVALPCFATDVAVLRNGFSIRHERREVMGDITRMYVSADGSSYVDVPTAEIERFEVDDGASAFGLQAAPVAERSASSEVAGSGTLKPDSQSPKPDLHDVVNAASGRYRLDPDLVNSVIKAESGFNVRAVSPKGAQGLMQLMPGTALHLGVPDAFDPQANVEGGARYLRELLERYNFDLVKALAAYNAGTRRVEQYGGVPPYFETRAYVRRIVLDFNRKKLAQKSASRGPSGGPSGGKSAAKKPAPLSSLGVRAEAKTRPPQGSE